MLIAKKTAATEALVSGYQKMEGRYIIDMQLWFIFER